MSHGLHCEEFTGEGRACVMRPSHVGDCKSTPTLQQILTFEARPHRNAGVKEDRIRTEFGISAVRYYQLLVAAVHTEEALTLDPTTTRRVLRQLIRQHPTE